MVLAGIQPTYLLCDGAKKCSILIKSLTGLSSSQPNPGGSSSVSSCTAFIWSDVFDKLVKWLEEVQKGCSDKYLFYFTVWPLGQLDFQ